ncbi:hypothetical protein [Paraglaciecola arctica]|uniref:hypothetical protein n=1 Tax=Paraglaciecola arctica TaxID=1128911 RepID=UPI001C075AA9|nr:hypothetical protein [Paraglaciecola arctica]MBU3003203.1 hypothetical protein [Paraglaciecola arctica]
MQKLGIDNLQSQKLSELELEIVDMQSTSLGIAGKKLRKSIDEYEKAKTKLFPKNNQTRLLQKVADNTYELMLQREFIGFIDGNSEWVRKHFAVPQ